jgi:hypothetical protein
MYYPPLDSNTTIVKDRRKLSDFLFSNLPKNIINKSKRVINSDLLCKLLLISDINSHTYYGKNNNGKPLTALFHYGKHSKKL